MKRAFVLVLDSFGIGASLDASKFGDAGADTFGNIALFFKENPLILPNLASYGLGLAATASTSKILPGFDPNVTLRGAYGYGVEVSYGKDTPSGHWEMMGVPVLFDWGYFQKNYPSFPADLINDFIQQTNLPGILGNKHASGTTIIEELGEEHIRTKKPIVYTSGDSVFQIAAHEKYFGLEKLYAICAIARKLVDKYHIGRVIARPFIGEPGYFQRTANRCDLITPPPSSTLLDYLIEANKNVIAIGKIADIFAHRGISKIMKAENDMGIFDQVLTAAELSKNNSSLIFANFTDFDSKYGHRRDAMGYRKALEAFDVRLPELEKILQLDDIVIITADHGCDPTREGSDHTREHVPILIFGKKIKPAFIGRRDTFADIGQTLAEYFDVRPLEYGLSFLSRVTG